MTTPTLWQRLRHHPFYPAALLATVAGLCAASLGGMAMLTGPAIAMAERADSLVAIAEVMSSDLFDGDPLAHCQPWSSQPTMTVCTLTKAGVASGALVTTSAKGYGGPIRLLIGIDASGIITGVRVTGHSETPGLGDLIDRRKGPWIDSFAGRSLANTSADGWRVRKDGGDFDQFTGATITPRAVVTEIHASLERLAQQETRP